MPLRRRLLFAALAVLALAALALAGWRLALQRLEAAVLGALGPRATLAALQLRWEGVELQGLRLRAERSGPQAWPAEDELRAERVRLRPQWASVWRALTGGEGGWQIARVDVDGAYLSVLRGRDGRLRALPSLLGDPAARRDAAPLAVLVGTLALHGATLDFLDARVARPPHRLHFSGLQAELGPIAWPALDQPMPLRIDAVMHGAGGGAARDGRVHVDGTLTPATRDARLALRLDGVDLRVLQPYLLRLNEGGVERGRLDLQVDATVRGQQLHAPGRVRFSELALGRRGVLDTVAGVPQQLVLKAMEERGRIELDFVLEGRLDDPAFSLEENLSTRIAVGLAKALGVSVGGLVEGLGSVVKGLFGR
ncbi:DUF748 domain-containing protein [Piscinibacter sakaiensis]|uniref:Putative exported protein n=1 Tax=Piscinibacter sakaiensis TaxID=1547922 RepID=A0A0K8P4N6_PISS1|nr:DUF748 domain-containing protein [Piscinibacter sakaiensis]GAP37489.1 putative exported protein [Piscinibacter sakaiensis]